MSTQRLLVQGKKREREEPVLLPEGWLDFGAAELAAAAAAVERETATVRAAMGHASKADEEYAEAWAVVAGEFIYLPGKDGASQVRRVATGCVLPLGSLLSGPGSGAQSCFTLACVQGCVHWPRVAYLE